jgi:hypothetical protein
VTTYYTHVELDAWRVQREAEWTKARDEAELRRREVEASLEAERLEREVRLDAARKEAELREYERQQ